MAVSSAAWEARPDSDPLPGWTPSQDAPPETCHCSVPDPVFDTLRPAGGETALSIATVKENDAGLMPILGAAFTFRVTVTA